MDAAEELRRVTQRFFRHFGAFAADATPCGKPIAMVHAHALMILSGHVAQRSDAQDGRSRRVSLTARGERLAREVDATSKARFEALLKALPAPRRSSVIESLRLLVSALEPTNNPSPGVSP